MAKRKPSSPKRTRVRDVNAISRRILPAHQTALKAILIYGRSGSGKTRLVGTAGEEGKTLVIAPDPGTLTIRRSKVEVYKMTTYEEIDEVYWFLMNGKHTYRFVALDDLTALQQQNLSFVLQENAEVDLAANPNMPDRQIWGQTGQMMRKTITEFRDIPGVMTIFTAKERRRENEDDDVESDYVVGPEVMPSVKNFLLGAVDIVGRLYVREVEEGDKTRMERRLLTATHPVFDAKDRTGTLARIERNPTIPKLLAKIKE